MADILLIEPAYKNKYPPIGLMKISYFHKYIYHDYVRFCKGTLPEGLSNKKWDRVYVTTLFTFEWEKTKEALEYALSVVKPAGKVFTGGILATLRPEWIAKEFPNVINNPGLLNHTGTLGLKGEECVDTLPLDYHILDDIKDEYVYPEHDAYFTYMTRGCGMNCTFCAVKTLEPKYNPYISITENIHRIDKEFGPKKDLLLMDNNVLRSPDFDHIVDEIKALGFYKGAVFKNPRTGKMVERHVDFNQGLDAFLLTEHKAKRLGELAIKPARIAFDHVEDEEVYKQAIRYCAHAGIDYMSNYLLYNGEDFTGKGHKYHADTPEDLYYRMHVTMELGEELTKSEGRKISIFSFPMRYIPLDNDKRGFIGAHWNAKYLRAFQCMLIPTRGKGIQGRSFFEADFGKDETEFVEFLSMPERLLERRGHFEERKDEDPLDRAKRYKQWDENQILIGLWRRLYKMLDHETVMELISNNRFSVHKLDELQSPDLIKFYSLYLTETGFMNIFSECNEHTCGVIKNFVQQDLAFMYKRILKHASETNLHSKQLVGLVKYFGVKFIKEWLLNLNVFSGNNKNKVQVIDRLNRRYHYCDFDFSLLQYLPLFDQAGVFTKDDKNKIQKWTVGLNDKDIRNILLKRVPDLRRVMVSANDSQPGAEIIIAEIEEQIKRVYQQLSLF